jgi:hypothetical protein
MDSIKDLLPVLIPFIIIELILLIVSLTHVIRHNHYRFGNRLFWILVILLFQFIGPILYFVLGKEED